MKIDKIKIEDKENKVYLNYPADRSAGEKDFRMSFSLSCLEERNPVVFEGENLSSCHVLLDGQGTFCSASNRDKALMPMQICSCEEGERIEVTGNGHLFNMVMSGGVRGFIHVLTVSKETDMYVGESVGPCMLALIGDGGGFCIETETDGKYFCKKGEGFILQLNQREFNTLRIVPEHEGMKLISASGVFLSPHDFGKYIGVRLLERGMGTCRARLEIRPEHMNPIGTVHGGCLFTLADAACGIAASSTGGICTTVTSNIQFLNAAFRPKYLTAEAKPKKLGRKVRNFLVEIRDDKEILICTVDFVFYSLQQ